VIKGLMATNQVLGEFNDVPPSQEFLLISFSPSSIPSSSDGATMAYLLILSLTT
jgi:hypothetical protein